MIPTGEDDDLDGQHDQEDPSEAPESPQEAKAERPPCAIHGTSQKACDTFRNGVIALVKRSDWTKKKVAELREQWPTLRCSDLEPIRRSLA